MNLPNDTQRHLIIGRTGSGKSQLATYLLSLRRYDLMPWVICNFKDDELLNQIPGVTELDGLKLPKPKQFTPGLYMARPDIDDWDGMEAMLAEMWKRTHIGLYVDEALVISAPKHPAYRRILTQGRSRRVPVVACTQRPVDLDRYNFSESEYISIMALSDNREPEKIRDMIGGDTLNMDILPEYHSYYLDRIKRTVSIIAPVPDAETILEQFDRRLKRDGNSRLI